MENKELLSKEMKGKIRIDMERMDQELQRHFDKAWMSQQSNHHDDQIEEVKEDWEIDCSKLLIKNFIANGGFGSVYKGIYNGQDVAVKVLNLGNESKKATLRKIFQQEISVWNKLDHPNITKFIGARRGISDVSIIVGCDIEMPRNAWCLVVEYIAGGTLKSYLIKNRVKRLPFNLVIQLALDIAKGLSYLHSHKIVHRDVKTENMLLNELKRVKITDFGVSRFESLNPTEMTGQTGTLGYMAPEVLSGSAYDHKCDVYSFGICLWEIYCCAMPFCNMNRLQKTSALIDENRRPEIPEHCPTVLANVMKQCWDRDPTRRPEMKEVIDMLEVIARNDKKRFRSRMKGCFCFLKQPEY